jgi:hypothetical protein
MFATVTVQQYGSKHNTNDTPIRILFLVLFLLFLFWKEGKEHPICVGKNKINTAQRMRKREFLTIRNSLFLCAFSNGRFLKHYDQHIQYTQHRC